MTITHRQILDIVIIAYYVVGLSISIFLVIKHGFKRSSGWFYLVLLAFLRLIGGAAGYASIDHPSKQSLLEASVICTSIGISPLLLALLGILERVNTDLNGYGVSKNYRRITHIPIIVGLILAIVAGTKEFSIDSSTLTTGQHLQEVAVILFMVSYAAVTAMAVILFSKKQWIPQGETKLLLAGFLSLPFIFVRVLYSVISAFDHNSSTFSIESDTNAAVVVQTIMSVLMEFIVVAIFIGVGLISSKVPRGMAQNGSAAAPNYSGTEGAKVEQGYGAPAPNRY